jgi:hypothetical protein
LDLQLCDIWAYSLRKREEIKAGAAAKPIDQRGVELVEARIHTGHQTFQDPMDWMTLLQKKERPGDKTGSA